MFKNAPRPTEGEHMKVRFNIYDCKRCPWCDRWGRHIGGSLLDLAANPERKEGESMCLLANREFTGDEYYAAFKDSPFEKPPEWCPLRRGDVTLHLVKNWTEPPKRVNELP